MNTIKKIWRWSENYDGWNRSRLATSEWRVKAVDIGTILSLAIAGIFFLACVSEFGNIGWAIAVIPALIAFLFARRFLTDPNL